jgi:hypothetical protein
MQKDYKFLTPVVSILCQTKYEPLLNYDPFEDGETNNDSALIMELVKEIREYFKGKTYHKEGNGELLKTIDRVSDTLVTKVLLGTLGCTVAYDTYVKKGLKHHGLTQKVGIKSFEELKTFANDNKAAIGKILSRLDGVSYPPMKIIDMYFFEEGFAL